MTSTADTLDYKYFAAGTNSAVNTNITKVKKPASPTAPSELSLSNSPAPAVDFQALVITNLVTPPDTFGAVGPSHVMTMLNSEVRIQSRTGATNSTTPLLTWWGSLSPQNLFDPKLIYDSFAGRWIAVVGLDTANITNAAIALAISANSDPTGSWTFYRWDVDTNNLLFADRPMLGLNNNWIAISTDLYKQDTDGYFKQYSSRIHAFDRTNAYSGIFTYTTFDRPAGEEGAYAPAITYDSAQTNLFFLRTSGTTNREIGIWKLSGTASNPSFSNQIGRIDLGLSDWARRKTVTLSDFSFPVKDNSAPQYGSTNKIQAGDDRMESVFVRNNSIWATHTVFLPAGAPTRSAIQWLQYSIEPFEPVQAGRLDDADGHGHFGYPWLAVNKFNDVLIGFTRFSDTTYPSAAYAFRAESDRPSTFRNTYVYKAGVDFFFLYSPFNRWGDYSSTVADPLNETDFWTIQEYAETRSNAVKPEEQGRWGTWWAKVAPAVPSNDGFTDATTISGTSGSTNGVLYRATKESGEPAHAGSSTYSRSIWFKWTPATSGAVTFNAIGSSEGMPLLLAIYTGSSVSSLTSVAFDTDASSTLGSKLSFNAVSGTTYRIVVANKALVADLHDNVVLNWIQPSAPVFVIHPQDTNIVASNPLVLTSLALGAPTPSYQWYKNTNTLLSSGTFQNYTNSAIQLSDQAVYHVVSSNSYGLATSSYAHVWTYASGAADFRGVNLLSNNTYLQFTVAGVTTHVYQVQGTFDFTNWVSVSTNNASFNFGTNTTTNALQFFRAVYQ